MSDKIIKKDEREEIFESAKDVSNALPTSYIISESRIIVDEFNSYLKEKEQYDFLTNWKKKNDAPNMRETEALIEFMAKFTDEEEWLDKGSKQNREYLAEMLKKDQLSPKSPLNHCSVTVLFNNISMLAIKKILAHRLVGLTISDKPYNLPAFSFWIPPSFEADAKLSGAYGEIFAQLNVIKNQLVNRMKLWEIKDNEEVKKKVQDMSRLFPWGLQVTAGITAGLGTWRHLLKLCANQGSDDELRYTFLFLGKKLKERYGNVFQDMILEDAVGKKFGMDTLLSAPSAWKAFNIGFKL